MSDETYAQGLAGKGRYHGSVDKHYLVTSFWTILVVYTGGFSGADNRTSINATEGEAGVGMKPDVEGVKKEKLRQTIRDALKDAVVFQAIRYDRKKKVTINEINIVAPELVKSSVQKRLRDGWVVKSGSIEIDPDMDKERRELKRDIKDLKHALETYGEIMVEERREDYRKRIQEEENELRDTEETLNSLKVKLFRRILEGEE